MAMKTIREDIYKLIFDEYSVEPEFPWSDAPNACIFRHSDNRKWFAIIMSVKNSSLITFIVLFPFNTLFKE